MIRSIFAVCLIYLSLDLLIPIDVHTPKRIAGEFLLVFAAILLTNPFEEKAK